MQQSVSSMQTNTPHTNEWMKVSFIILFLAFMSSVWTTQAATANPPGKMTFQGFLTDASNPPVPLGNTSPVNKEITFKIYDNGTGGTVKWAETQIVTIDKGHFSVLLGEGSSVSGQPHSTDLSTVFSGPDASDRWMGITVDSAEITPRIQFFAAPYAQLAKAATSLTGSAITASGNFSATGDIRSKGNIAALFFEDRSNNASNWGWYADSGVARLWSGNDKMTVDANGKLTTGEIQALSFIEANGWVKAKGGNAALIFDEQVNITGVPWQWYSNGGLARLWHGADKITINDSAVINSGGLQVTASNVIQLGHGVSGRETSAGQIGYETHGAGRLHILGAGTTSGNRKIQMWDKVGINTDPQSELDISSPSLWRSLTVRGSGGSDAVVIGNVNNKATIGGHTGALSGWADLVFNPGGGKVGIGTSTPSAPLDVRGAATHTTAYRYLSGGGTGLISTPTAANYSILTDQRILAAEFNAFSDKRVKNIIGKSDTLRDLEMIKQICAVDYQMIDQVANGDSIKKGFLAQDVEQIMPEAVTKNKQFIPDIYTAATSCSYDAQNHTHSLEISKNHGLEVGDRVRLIAKSKEFYSDVIDVLSDSKFVVNKMDPDLEAVFVYGKEVSDFRTLDYDRIFSTGIGAIQELARQTEVLEKRTSELEAREQQIVSLQNRVSELEGVQQQLDELKKQVAILLKNQGGSDRLASLSGN